MTLDGVEVAGINKVNFGQYLGRVVTNYSGAETSVTIGSETYTVSNTYRLYWIDWTNKYGDGVGTIYLKADYSANNYELQQETTESAIDAVSASNALTTKIRNLNPGLYVGATPNPPAVNSNNMKAVRWLTNPSNWNDLKTGVASSIADKVNYIVGAPSLEMLMDSYNTHYGLTNGTMDTEGRDSTSPRTKLAYMYPAPTGLNNYGYVVGPSNDHATAVDGYKYSTSSYTVQTDSTIDSVYFPGDDCFYWLASPSANYDSAVMYVAGNYGGLVYNNVYNGTHALCPIVSLAADVQL